MQRFPPRPLFEWFERWWAQQNGIYEYAPGTILRLQNRHYHGPTFQLIDGTVVESNAPVLEVHLDNYKLGLLHMQERDPRRVGLLFTRRLTHAFSTLAAYLRDNPVAVALYANTLHWQGAQRLGWEIRDLPAGPHRYWLQIWQLLLVWYYHPQGTLRTRGGKRSAYVRQIWISRRRLLQLYAFSRRSALAGRPQELALTHRLQPL